jgi:hypothetical protein
LDYEDSIREVGFLGEAGNDSSMEVLSIPSPRAPPALDVWDEGDDDREENDLPLEAKKGSKITNVEWSTWESWNEASRGFYEFKKEKNVGHTAKSRVSMNANGCPATAVLSLHGQLTRPAQSLARPSQA